VPRHGGARVHERKHAGMTCGSLNIAKRQFAGMHETSPDIQANIEAMVAEGDIAEGSRADRLHLNLRRGRPCRNGDFSGFGDPEDRPAPS
jgi:hypothetical protein